MTVWHIKRHLFLISTETKRIDFANLGVNKTTGFIFSYQRKEVRLVKIW